MKLKTICIALLFSFLLGCVPEKEKNARLIVYISIQDDYVEHLNRYIEAERTPEKIPPKSFYMKLVPRKGSIYYEGTTDKGHLVFNDLKPDMYDIEDIRLTHYGGSLHFDKGGSGDIETSSSDFRFVLSEGEEKVLKLVLKKSGLEHNPATAKTIEIKDIQHDKVTVVGELTHLSVGSEASVGFVVNKTNAFQTQKNTLGTFEATITNLEPEKEYTAHAYVFSKYKISYGEKIKFTTKKEPFPISSSLVAYYTFDNANCNDYWGNIDYHGILQGVGEPPTFVTNTPNGNGKAMKCTGEKFFRLIKKPISINHEKITDHTVSVWVNTKNSTGELYTEEGGYCGGNAPSIALILSSNKINKFNLNYTDILFDGNWHHVVFIFDQNFCSLYIDGEFMERIKHDMCYQGSNVNAIGKNYVGLMDNLRLYTRKLSDTEIRKLYQSKM